MLATTLQRLNDEGALTVAQMAEILDLSPSTVYAHLSGASRLRADQLRTLIRGARRPDVALALLSYVTSGTPIVATYIDADADVDGDGDVDTDDAVQAAIQAADDLVQTLKLLTGPGEVSDVYAEHVNALCTEVIQRVSVVPRVVDVVLTAQGKRRKCRPLSTKGVAS